MHQSGLNLLKNISLDNSKIGDLSYNEALYFLDSNLKSGVYNIILYKIFSNIKVLELYIKNKFDGHPFIFRNIDFKFLDYGIEYVVYDSKKKTKRLFFFKDICLEDIINTVSELGISHMLIGDSEEINRTKGEIKGKTGLLI